MSDKSIPNITLAPCESSRIQAHGHCAETNTLALVFKSKDNAGTTYHYSGFTADDYAALQVAESIGKHFGSHINIKDEDGNLKYPFTRIEERKDDGISK